MRCESIMTAEVETVRSGDTVVEAARKMRDLNIGFLPVCDRDGVVEGVITDRDITIRAVAEKRGAATKVDDIMKADVVACSPDDDVRRAEELMRVNQKSRIVCIDDDGRLAGIISTADLVRYEDERLAAEVISDVTEREASGPH
jgi:CBS domain-containing protein